MALAAPLHCLRRVIHRENKSHMLTKTIVTYEQTAIAGVIITVSHQAFTDQLARLPPISLFGVTLVRSGKLGVGCGSHLHCYCC